MPLNSAGVVCTNSMTLHSLNVLEMFSWTVVHKIYLDSRERNVFWYYNDFDCLLIVNQNVLSTISNQVHKI